MATNGSAPVYILYKIINSNVEARDPCFNAFCLPHGVKPTLASVKQHCTALYGLNHLGPEGYHWRVCLQDRPIPGENTNTNTNTATDTLPTSWWDIQDENASLPIKESTQLQLQKFLTPATSRGGGGDSSSDGMGFDHAAKATFKNLGKVMSQAVGGVDHHNSDTSGPLVKVVAFKLLDLIKMTDDFTSKHHGTSAGPTVRTSRPPLQQQQRSAGPSQQQQQQHRAAPPPQQQQQQRPPTQHRASPPAPAQQRPQQQHQQRLSEPSLMDFGPTPTTTTSSTTRSTFVSPPANESRAEKLKREYNKKQETASRIWDDIDQRWVEKDANVAAKVNSAPSSLSTLPKKEIGISLDPANAVGKSATVQAAVHARVNTMRREQDKAVQEVREREAKKKQLELEEDEVRKRLEPKIKAWSEEHGKKKQLRALLASLHVILWPGAKWKQVTIGDLLDDKKVLRSFQRASLVVHPDKTGHLDSEQRFLAKRIFDALCQAKAQFDDGK